MNTIVTNDRDDVERVRESPPRRKARASVRSRWLRETAGVLPALLPSNSSTLLRAVLFLAQWRAVQKFSSGCSLTARPTGGGRDTRRERNTRRFQPANDEFATGKREMPGDRDRTRFAALFHDTTAHISSCFTTRSPFLTDADVRLAASARRSGSRALSHVQSLGISRRA